MKRNPVHSSGKKFSYKKVSGIRVPTKPLTTKRERKEFSKTADYMERIEKLRPYFRDVFTPDAGFNLHDVEQWTPAQKRKITRYFRVMAPRIVSEYKQVKRFRIPAHLREAIKSTLQEELLPGQTAAVFSIDPGQRVEIKFTKRDGAVVKRAGVIEEDLRFDKNKFLVDPIKELHRVLTQTDANLFKIITGANKTTQVYQRDELGEAIALFINSYPIGTKGRGFTGRSYDQWLNGLIAYKNTTYAKLHKESVVHKNRVNEQRALRASERAKASRIFDRSARLTGRAGRVK